MNKNIILNLNQEELIKFQLGIILNSKSIQYNNTLLICMTYLFLYGFKEGKLKLENNKITLNKAVWSNNINFLRKMKLVEGKGENTILNKKLTLFKDLKKLTIYINESN